MSKIIKKYMKIIFDAIFPFIDNYICYKKLLKKIRKLETDFKKLEIMSGYSNLSYNQAKEFYQLSLEHKDKIENKAKSNIVGLSISVTLVFGLSTIFLSINSKIVIIFGIMAVIYMMIAGILSVYVIVNLNRIYLILPRHIVSDDLINVEKCIHNTELNYLNNIIRNNYVFTSYECMRNSIICLGIMFMLSLIPNSSNSPIDYHLKELQNITQSIDEIKIFKTSIDNINDSIVNFIEKHNNLKILNQLEVEKIEALDNSLNNIQEQLKDTIEKIEKLEEANFTDKILTN
jgi:hypothetical protein